MRKWFVVTALSFLVLLSAAFSFELVTMDFAHLSGIGGTENNPLVARETVPKQQDELQDAMVALDQYLNTDCEVGEEGESLKLILKYQDELEPVLITILLEGPDVKTLEEFEVDLDQQWRKRDAFVGDMSQSDMQQEGLSPEDAEIALMTSEEEYKALYTNQFIQKYQEKAAVALVAFESKTSLEAVQGFLAETENEDLRHIIDLALKRFQ